MKRLAIWSPRPSAKPIELIAPNITLYGLPVVNINEKPFEPSAISLTDAFIFVSRHAVKHFFAQIPRDTLSNKTIIAIGKRTTEALQQQGIPPHVISPPPFNSEALLADATFQQLPDRNFVIVCGMGGRTLLQNTLQKREKTVRRIECYQRDKANLLPRDMVQFITGYAIDGIVLSSGEIAEIVASQLATANLSQAFKLPVFALSERIAQRATQLGFHNIFIAEQANQDFLYQRMINWREGELKNEQK